MSILKGELVLHSKNPKRGIEVNTGQGERGPPEHGRSRTVIAIEGGSIFLIERKKTTKRRDGKEEGSASAKKREKSRDATTAPGRSHKRTAIMNEEGLCLTSGRQKSRSGPVKDWKKGLQEGLEERRKDKMPPGVGKIFDGGRGWSSREPDVESGEKGQRVQDS